MFEAVTPTVSVEVPIPALIFDVSLYVSLVKRAISNAPFDETVVATFSTVGDKDIVTQAYETATTIAERATRTETAMNNRFFILFRSNSYCCMQSLTFIINITKYKKT